MEQKDKTGFVENFKKIKKGLILMLFNNNNNTNKQI